MNDRMLAEIAKRKIGFVNVELVDAMIRFIEPGWLCVDAGANQGDFTYLMARMVGAEGGVLAFEPDREVFKELQRNTEILTNVERRSEALYSNNGSATFYRTANSGYSSFVHFTDAAEDYKVPVVTLDKFLLAPQPRFMKVDCEGADEHVLRGAEQILRRGVDCVIAEVHFQLLPHFQCSDQSMREYMQSLGYDCYLLEKGYRPLLLRPGSKIERLPKDGPIAVNVMFAKSDRVEELWSNEEKSDG